MNIHMRDPQIGPKNQVKEIVSKFEEVEKDQFDKNEVLPNEHE